MINKLRRKFIAIAMISVFAVLVLILGGITTANYGNIITGANERISLIEQNGGYFPIWQDYFELFPFTGRGSISQESQFDTRYFSVRYNAKGEPVSVNTGSIAAVDGKAALIFAQQALKEKKSTGFYGNYRYKVSDYINGKLVVFVDCARELSSFRTFVTAELLTGFSGLALVFILVLIFSKIIIKPIGESYEKQKMFITNASHEIKTPLAIINAANEVTELENGETEWTNSISKQVKRLSTLTQKLIMLSRLDEENKPEKISFNLSDLCLETLQSFDAVAQAKEYGYYFSIQPDIIYNGDKNLLTQLLTILLDNSMKYTNEKGQIHFSLNQNGKNTVLTLQNTVDEIQKGNLDILFERFYRKDTARSGETGSFGLGLSVAKAIVNAHGGKISAKSTDGKSIIFTVTL